METKTSAPETFQHLKGMFFHTLEKNGAAKNQGYVHSVLSGGYLFVRLFSFLTGDIGYLRLWHIEDLHGAQFYYDDETMRYAYEYNMPRPPAPEPATDE